MTTLCTYCRSKTVYSTVEEPAIKPNGKRILVTIPLHTCPNCNTAFTQPYERELILKALNQ